MRKKVVIGMSGGIDSTVAAYLLKTQGFECIGISIDFFSKGFAKLGKTSLPNFFVPDLNLVSNICDKLGIPFYAINAQNDFENFMLDLIVSNRLEGVSQTLTPQLSRSLFSLLWDRCKKLEGDSVATGHYARIHEDRIHNTVTLNRTNFNDSDQCYLLTRVDQVILDNLQLPLSELRKDDVERLGENLGVKFKEKSEPATKDEQVAAEAEVIDTIVAKSLRPDGLIIHYRSDRHLGDHKGVHNFYMGQRGVTSSYKLHNIDKELEVVSIESKTGSVYLLEYEEKKHEACFIDRLRISKGSNLTKPFSCFIQVEGKPDLHAVTFYYKNNRFAILSFSEPLSDLYIGNMISLFSSNKGGGKLLGTGFICYLGEFGRIHKAEAASVDDDFKKRIEDNKDLPKVRELGF